VEGCGKEATAAEMHRLARLGAAAKLAQLGARNRRAETGIPGPQGQPARSPPRQADGAARPGTGLAGADLAAGVPR